MSLLQVNHLVVEFPHRRGTLRALDDISFDIAPGEILGLVGDNSAGKSTYMSMVPTVAWVPLARSLTTIGYSMFLTPTLSMRISRRSGVF